MAITHKHLFFELVRDVKLITTPLLQHLNIHYFAFKRTYHDGHKIYLFNQPNYYAWWFENKFYLLGNRDGEISHYQDGYDLWEFLPDPHGLYDKAQENFGVAHGLTVTKRHANYCDCFHFATRIEYRDIKLIYYSHRSIFESFIKYFLDKGSTLIARAYQHKVLLPLAREVAQTSAIVDINRFLQAIQPKSKSFTLTQRELDCIPYLKSGCTNKEISNALQLSIRTVEEYTNRLKEKFECRNKNELIAVLSQWSKD